MMSFSQEHKDEDDKKLSAVHSIIDVDIKEQFVKIILDNILKKMTSKIRLIGSSALYYARQEYAVGEKSKISKNLLGRDFDILTTYHFFGELIQYLSGYGNLEVINHNLDKNIQNIPYISHLSEMKERGIAEILTYEWTFNKSSSNSGAQLLLNICNINEFRINIDVIIMNDKKLGCQCDQGECNLATMLTLDDLIKKFSPKWPIHCSARNIMCYYLDNDNIIFSLFKKTQLFTNIIVNHKKEMYVSDYFESLKYFTWMIGRLKYRDVMRHVNADEKVIKYNVHKTINHLFYGGVNVKYFNYSFNKLRKYINTQINFKYFSDDAVCTICQYELKGEEYLATQSTCKCLFHFTCLSKYQLPYLMEYMKQLRINDSKLLDHQTDTFQFDNPDGVQIGGHKCPNCRTQGLTTKFGRKIEESKWILPTI